MLTIYDNIPASSAGSVTLSTGGAETYISLRASVWGTTQVNIQTYNWNDTYQHKFWSIPASPINQNVDINLGYIPAQLLVYFTVSNPGAVTTQLLVNAFLSNCCDSEKSSIIQHP